MNVGAIIGRKFNHAPGIKVVDGVIVEWPEALGSQPTDQQIAEWATAEDAAARITTIEIESPITHRALRELILTIGEIYPAGKNTVFYQRVLAAEQAIQVERAKL